jgi:hypothetical protein
MAKRKGEQTDRWKRQWYVPSKSGGKDHKVSEDHEGKFYCDCWPFRKNRICDHIRDARAGGGRLIGEPEIPEPTLDYGWVVTQVTPVIADGKIQTLQVPQLPFGNEHTHFVLTVFYDLLFYSVRWSTIREAYHQDHITEGEVREFIRSRGRCVLRELGGNTYTVVCGNPPTIDEIQNKEEAAYV